MKQCIQELGTFIWINTGIWLMVMVDMCKVGVPVDQRYSSLPDAELPVAKVGTTASVQI